MQALPEILKGLAALAWPVIVIILLFRFRDSINDVIESAKSRRVEIDIGGNKLTLDEAASQQNAILADLQNQVVAINKRLDALTSSSGHKSFLSPNVAAASPASDVRSILWVDDQPRSNSYEVDLLQRLGVTVVQSASTAEGLSLLGKTRFDRIISSMGRSENNSYNPKAGIDFAQAVRQIDKDVPIIIYTSLRGADMVRAEALASGVNAVVTGGTSLLEALQIHNPSPSTL